MDFTVGLVYILHPFLTIITVTATGQWEGGREMMKSLTGVLLAAAVLIALSGCGQGSGPSVAADGSTSMEKAVGILGEVFQQDTGVRFTFNPTGSGAGIRAVQEGRCDLGLSSRWLKEEERELGLEATVLAYDGIALIVNPQNPISDLNLETIGRIFTGSVTNWSELGGEAEEIVLIGREAGSGTREGFEWATGTLNACPYRQELTSTGDVITTVSRNPGAIGYASIASVQDTVKVLSVAGVPPTEENIRQGSYPVQRPFLLVTAGEVSQETGDFPAFATSDRAREYLSMAGVVWAN